MPLYEYVCSDCGAELEVRQKFSDDPLKDCPTCGNPSLERLVSQSSFALKGGGWYADGYGSKKPDTQAAKEGSGGEKKSEGEGSDAKKPDASKGSDGGGSGGSKGDSGSGGSGSGSDSKKAANS
jgi:putative FmdB family regulatory protein